MAHYAICLGFWSYPFSCCSNAHVCREVETRAPGKCFRKSEASLLCISTSRYAFSWHTMTSQRVLRRSSVSLIFDISYGVHCVTIKDEDNLEMPPSIYTQSVSVRESRLKLGRQKEIIVKTACIKIEKKEGQQLGKRVSCV